MPVRRVHRACRMGLAFGLTFIAAPSNAAAPICPGAQADDPAQVRCWFGLGDAGQSDGLANALLYFARISAAASDDIRCLAGLAGSRLGRVKDAGLLDFCENASDPAIKNRGVVEKAHAPRAANVKIRFPPGVETLVIRSLEGPASRVVYRGEGSDSATTLNELELGIAAPSQWVLEVQSHEGGVTNADLPIANTLVDVELRRLVVTVDGPSDATIAVAPKSSPTAVIPHPFVMKPGETRYTVAGPYTIETRAEGYDLATATVDLSDPLVNGEVHLTLARPPEEKRRSGWSAYAAFETVVDAVLSENAGELGGSYSFNEYLGIQGSAVAGARVIGPQLGVVGRLPLGEWEPGIEAGAILLVRDDSGTTDKTLLGARFAARLEYSWILCPFVTLGFQTYPSAETFRSSFGYVGLGIEFR